MTKRSTWINKIGWAFAAVVGYGCLSVTARAADETSVIDALNSPGHIALMRHAIAPGNGDPDSFVLRDCSTQRNLSDAGREQARATGKFLRDRGVSELAVYTSQWCRCLETARLLGFGDVEELAFLNSFYQQWERSEPQMTQLTQWLSDSLARRPSILVTHQVNITALTDVFAASGEIVVVKILEGGAVELVGTIQR